MSNEHPEIKMHDAPLTIKDRIPYTYVLTNQILTIQKSRLSEELSQQEKEEVIKSFLPVIPTEWEDKQFLKDIKKATKKVKVDIRPHVTANTRMSLETCQKLGIPAYKEEIKQDYHKLMRACINLLNRRKLLSKIDRVEKLEGIELDANLEDSKVWESELLGEQE